MAWSDQMPFEDPAMTAALARLEKRKAEYNHALALTKSKSRKTRLRAKKKLCAITNAVLRAGLEADRYK